MLVRLHNILKILTWLNVTWWIYFFYSSSFALSCRFIWHIFIYHLSFSHSQSQVYIHADRLTPLLLLLNTMGRFQLILDDLVLCCMHTEIFFSNFHLNQLGMWLHSGGSLNISRTNEKCKILIFQKAFLKSNQTMKTIKNLSRFF
jgi:hypothetical protein